MPLDVESANSIWIDNDNFVNYSYDQDGKNIIKTNTCVTENSTEYYNTYTKSISSSKDTSIFNNLFTYVCFVLLIILCIIYWLYKRK